MILILVSRCLKASLLFNLTCQCIFDYLNFKDYGKFREAFAFQFLFSPYFSYKETENIEEVLQGLELLTLEEINAEFNDKIPFTSEELKLAESENLSVRVGERLEYKTNESWIEELLIKIEYILCRLNSFMDLSIWMKNTFSECRAYLYKFFDDQSNDDIAEEHDLDKEYKAPSSFPTTSSNAHMPPQSRVPDNSLSLLSKINTKIKKYSCSPRFSIRGFVRQRLPMKNGSGESNACVTLQKKPWAKDDKSRSYLMDETEDGYSSLTKPDTRFHYHIMNGLLEGIANPCTNYENIDVIRDEMNKIEIKFAGKANAQKKQIYDSDFGLIRSEFGKKRRDGLPKSVID